jgi:hypothetical protein
MNEYERGALEALAWAWVQMAEYQTLDDFYEGVSVIHAAILKLSLSSGEEFRQRMEAKEFKIPEWVTQSTKKEDN